MQRFDLLNLVDVLTAVARTGTIIVALLLGQGLVAMALIQLAVSVLRGAWLVVMSHRLYPSLRMDPFTFNGATTGMIFSFSIYSFVIHLSTQVIYYTDALVIASFLPIGLLTFYAIGGSLVEYARTLTRAVSYAASPMASALDGVGDHERVRRLLVTSAKFSMVILLPVAITLLVRGASFIGLWMGPAYTELSGHVVFALALPLLFHAGSHGLGGIMLSIGKHKGLVPAMIAEAAANVGLSVTLVGTMGIVGVAWGTAIPALVSGTCFWPWYVRRAVGISAREYYETIWIRPWLAAVPFLLASMAVERWWPATSLLMFFAQVFLCLLPAVAADWWICLNQRDHESLRAAIRKLTGRPAGSQLASST
jgi:O-antigen/teichoic acid export membrane protein